MEKRGNKILDSKAEIKKMKITVVLSLSALFLILTLLVAVFSVYNMNHAPSMIYKCCNYIIIIASYILFALIGTTYAIQKYETNISKYVDTDILTSGINYERYLKDAQDMLSENKEADYAVFYADIQNFKYINDTFGYDVGDKLLMFISQKIRAALEGKEGFFARISADNYTVIIPYKDKNELVEPIYSIIDDICWFEDIQKEHYKPEIYVGIYCSGDDDRELSISEMIDRANMAQKSIKGSSEYHIAFYTEEIRERVIAEKELERRMDTALANGEFKAYFQPKYEVSTGEIVGAEALVRWDSPESGFMSPGKFIPLFEQNGFIINLDQFVFETVCRNMREWIDSGIKVVPVSINVSRLQFYKLDFVKRYTKIKEKYNIPDGLLELEFTESIVFENLDILRKIVLSLKKQGFSCSIDDFGSGYSSLNILKNLPMDTLKLDKLFFDDSENLERDKALISSVINMSRALDMKTVAEGIESWAQVEFLKEIGCDIIQGYVYSEPIPHARFTNLLEGNRHKEMPAEMRKTIDITREETAEHAIEKYATLVGMLEGLLVEVDFNTGLYKFLNLSNDKKDYFLRIAKKNANYNEMFISIVDKYVHPDDRQIVKNRCSSVAIMSAFYQNETKIITELRMHLRGTKHYEWGRMIVSRINQNADDNDFRALIYVEYKSSVTGVNKEIEMDRMLRNAMGNVCTFIYEFDINSMTFKKVFCNEDVVGEQPESGDIGWVYECYLPKVVDKEDLPAFLEFLASENVKNSLANGEKQMTITVNGTFLGKKRHMVVTIARTPLKMKDSEGKYILLCKME